MRFLIFSRAIKPIALATSHPTVSAPVLWRKLARSSGLLDGGMIAGPHFSVSTAGRGEIQAALREDAAKKS